MAYAPTHAAPASSRRADMRASQSVDAWGMPVTTRAPLALAAFNRSVRSYVAHRADTLRHVESALAADAELALAHVLRGFALRFLACTDYLQGARISAQNARSSLRARGGTPREELLVAALEAFCAGRVERALQRLARVSALHPRCLLSMKLQHALAFMYGRLVATRRSTAHVLSRFDAHSAEYGFVLGCHAFVLEESGAYAEAEAHARRALEHCPEDAWAFHALAHVMAAQGRTAEGLTFVRTRGPRFLEGNNFSAHLAWHHALFALAHQHHDEALAIYDRELTPPLGRDYRDAANCVSLLFRLERAGVDVADRWQLLADVAARRIGDHTLAFADAHYLLALVHAGRHTLAAEFVAQLGTLVARRHGTDARLQRALGVHLARGILALGRPAAEDAAGALRALAGLGDRLRPLGGSHV